MLKCRDLAHILFSNFAKLLGAIMHMLQMFNIIFRQFMGPKINLIWSIDFFFIKIDIMELLQQVQKYVALIFISHKSLPRLGTFKTEELWIFFTIYSGIQIKNKKIRIEHKEIINFLNKLHCQFDRHIFLSERGNKVTKTSICPKYGWYEIYLM